MKLVLVSLAALLLALVPETTAENNRVVCYYGSWAVYRPGRGKFDVEDIDPTLCTHLIYTFVGLGSDSKIKVLDAWNDLEEDYGLGAFKRFVKLKARNPQVKTMVAIGGWNEGSTKYSKMVTDDTKRATFVKSAVNFLKKYGFDGLDLDWEYPNQRGGQPSDVVNYVKLIKELREEFDKEGYLLTAAVAAAKFSMSLSYDVPMLSKYLDFINVMAYDLHGEWDKYTGNNAPLRPSSKDTTETSQQLNVIACINTWIEKGADPSKLVLGMGTYGRSFTLDNPSNTGLYSPAGQPGAPGKYTEEAGMLGYNEIVENSDWTVVWDDEQKVPYAFKGNQWVGFDNPRSLALKMEFAKTMGLGGGMIWSIDTDDFLGVSGTKFPLLHAINDALGNDVPTEAPPTEGPSTSHRPTKTTPTEGPTGPTTPNPNDPSKLCKEANTYVRDPDDCSKFYFCVLVDGKFKTFEFDCGDDMVFDPSTNSCNYPWLVQC